MRLRLQGGPDVKPVGVGRALGLCLASPRAAPGCGHTWSEGAVFGGGDGSVPVVKHAVEWGAQSVFLVCGLIGVLPCAEWPVQAHTLFPHSPFCPLILPYF